MLHRNVHLFVFGIARKIDGFHTIEQRRIDGVAVARCHEHHVGKVKTHIHIVIFELAILFGIEYFEQSGRRIAPHAGTDLVDFVQKEERIFHAHLGHGLDDLARHRTDVSTAVTADVARILHAAQSHAHVLAARGAGDRFTETGLADAGSAHQTQNRRLDLVDSTLHGQVFQDALLDLFQPPVIGVEDFLGLLEILVDFGLFLPGQRNQRFDVAANHRGFGVRRRHLL